MAFLVDAFAGYPLLHTCKPDFVMFLTISFVICVLAQRNSENAPRVARLQTRMGGVHAVETSASPGVGRAREWGG